MRREWLIVLGVLLPCAALLAGGVMWPSTHLDFGSAAVASADAAAQAPVETGPMEPQGDAAAPEDSALPKPVPAELEAAVNAVTPEITACFEDNGVAHLHGHLAVTIAFEPTREGRFRKVALVSRVADPRLAACLEDVFAEVAYVPSGRETFEPAQHTFIFDAPHR